MSAPAGSLNAGAMARAREYLCIDPFISDMPGACALATAFEIGLVDHLAQHARLTAAEISQAMQLDRRGLELLLDMLRLNGVLALSGDAVELTDRFTAALVFRDLLEAKLYFAKLVAADFLHLLTALLMEPAKFAEQARLFKLFSYEHAFTASAENYERTARWMRLTTALTTCEAGACIAAHDFSGYKRMLDVGGNSGEFALRICRAFAQLQATVFDLPLVCDIGLAHVADTSVDAAEAGRVRFVKYDRTQHEMPPGHDLITFKSMLHDWPDAEMIDFLRRAYTALEPGGTLVIFERGQLKLGDAQVAYGQLPLMLFFRSYRAPERYKLALEALGFHSVSMETIELDMPFILVTARKQATR